MRNSKISKWNMRGFDYLAKKTNFVKDCWLINKPGHQRWQEKKMDFIEKILHLEKGMKILDVFCGTGTATVSLAQRGYKVTGLDISKEMLCLAKKRAASRRVKINWIREDIRHISFRNDFDAVVAIGEPSFGYAEDHQENIKILEKMAQALKPGARFLIESYNKEFILRKQEWSEEGSDWAVKYKYNKENNKLVVKGILPARNGTGVRIDYTIYLYSKTEWKNLLLNVGIESMKIWDASSIPFYRDSLHSVNMLVSGIKRR